MAVTAPLTISDVNDALLPRTLAGPIFEKSVEQSAVMALARPAPLAIDATTSVPIPMDVPTAWAYLPDMARSFVQVAEQRHRLPAFETLHFAGYSLTGQDWADALEPLAREHGWLAPGEPLRSASLPGDMT